jgi:hypothetical protein
MPGVRVSQYYGLHLTQPFLDFVDICLDTDIPVFVNPIAIRALRSPWGHHCASLVQGYFSHVLALVKSRNTQQAQLLLSNLRERNEFHLGFSRGPSRGHAFGTKSAASVWAALSNSAAATTGLLKDLEDTCLLIDGIGPDMISDALCNILREPFIAYTQDMCRYYGIPLVQGVQSGPIWSAATRSWASAPVDLPIARKQKFILVPKVLVRYRTRFSYSNYYTHYLLPEMQNEELSAPSGLVTLLKDRTRVVYKKSLRRRYGSSKQSVVNATNKHPHILAKYKADIEKSAPPPLGHKDLAEIEGTQQPNWDQLLAQLAEINPGIQDAPAYETVIEKILSAAFYPSLCSPTKQYEIHNGRKRIDITYRNEAQAGFFYWLALNYPSALVFVECKNYGREVGNPDLDQLSGRFGPSRGQVGILICRDIKDRDRLKARCADTARDHRGYIIVLTDADIVAMIHELKSGGKSAEFEILRQQFEELIS